MIYHCDKSSIKFYCFTSILLSLVVGVTSGCDQITVNDRTLETTVALGEDENLGDGSSDSDLSIKEQIINSGQLMINASKDELESAGLSEIELAAFETEAEAELITAGSLAIEGLSLVGPSYYGISGYSLAETESNLIVINPFSISGKTVMGTVGRYFIGIRESSDTNIKKSILESLAVANTGSLEDVKNTEKLHKNKTDIHYSGAITSITHESIALIALLGLDDSDVEAAMQSIASNIIEEASSKEILGTKEDTVKKVISGVISGSSDMDEEIDAASANNPRRMAKDVAVGIYNEQLDADLSTESIADFKTISEIAFEAAAETMDDAMEKAVNVITELAIIVYNQTSAEISEIIQTVADQYEDKGIQPPENYVEYTDSSEVIDKLAEQGHITEEEKTDYQTDLQETSEALNDGREPVITNEEPVGPTSGDAVLITMTGTPGAFDKLVRFGSNMVGLSGGQIYYTDKDQWIAATSASSNFDQINNVKCNNSECVVVGVKTGEATSKKTIDFSAWTNESYIIGESEFFAVAENSFGYLNFGQRVLSESYYHSCDSRSSNTFWGAGSVNWIAENNPSKSYIILAIDNEIFRIEGDCVSDLTAKTTITSPMGIKIVGDTVLGYNSANVYYSINKGDSFAEWIPNNEPNGNLASLALINHMTAIAFTTGGDIFRSDNSGASWQRIKTGGPVYSESLFNPATEKLVVSDDQGNIYEIGYTVN